MVSEEFKREVASSEVETYIKKIKDRYKDDNSTRTIKTHLSCKCGIVGFYTAQELIKYYGECDSAIIYYEKDYGDNAVAIRNYLLIDSDIDYDKEIEVDRLCK